MQAIWLRKDSALLQLANAGIYFKSEGRTVRGDLLIYVEYWDSHECSRFIDAGLADWDFESV